MCGGLANRDTPWLRCNLDGYFNTPSGIALFEAKNTDSRNRNLWQNQIPDHAELQVMHSMAVTGADRAFVAGLIGGNDLIIHEVIRNDRIIDILLEAETKFWEHVTNDTPPEIDGHHATLQALTGAWPHNDGAREVDASEVTEIWESYQQAEADLEDANRRKKDAQANLAALMEGHDELRTGDRVWARTKRGRVNEKRLKADHPDLYANYLEQTTKFNSQAFKVDHPDLYSTHQYVSIQPTR